jgi:hypothetical protein
MVRKTEENVIQKKKDLRNTVLCFVCSEKDRREENVIQSKNLRNSVHVLCAVRKWIWNAGTGEHEGER